MPKIATSMNRLRPYWKTIKVGAVFAIAGSLLHTYASFQVMLATSVMTTFCLYLYFLSLNVEIVDHEIMLEGAAYQEEKKRQELSVLKFNQDNSEMNSMNDLDMNQAAFQNNNEAKTNNQSKDMDISRLLSRIEGLEEKVNHKEETIKNLQNTLEVIAQRLDGLNSTKTNWSQVEENSKSIHEMQEKLSRLDFEIQPVQSLEEKVNNLQLVCKKLVDAGKGGAELEKRREDLEKRLVPLITQLEGKLNQYAQQQPPSSAETEGRLFEIESKIGMIPNIMKSLEKTDERITHHDNKVNSLSASFLKITDSLNGRIDSLISTLQQSNILRPQRVGGSNYYYSSYSKPGAVKFNY